MGIFDRFSKSKPIEVKKEEQFTDKLDTLFLSDIALPKPILSRQHDWVLFGESNKFPKELIDLKNSSSIHSAILESEARLIAGNGFIFAPTRAESESWLIENFRLVPFWRKLDNIFLQVTKDQLLFGYSCFEVIYSMDRTRIVDMNYVDASRIACGKIDDDGKIDEYYYSDNWKDTIKCPPTEIDAFDTTDKKEDEFKQLVFIKTDINNMDYYSLPTYYPAIKWIKADAMMAEYNLSAIQQGFSPSIVFKFYKKPSPEERRMNAEAIKAQHGGAKNAGKALIFYADGKDLAPDVATLDATNIDGRLLMAADMIVQQIISAHRCHPQLMGIQTVGKLGFSNDLLQAWNIYNAMVVQPERKFILGYFKEVLVYNGVISASIEELVPIDITPAAVPTINIQNKP